MSEKQIASASSSSSQSSFIEKRRAVRKREMGREKLGSTPGVREAS